MTDLPFLRILLGPTASGKERAALACAERLGGEIVSVDSMKIYRRLDVGTAKPAPEDRARVRHHCVDFVDPEAAFSTAAYVAAAEAAIADIAARGKTPILSGGTALYYKALLEGLFEGPPADESVRAVLRARIAAEGEDALYAELAAADPASAHKIHPRDTRRVIRALEVLTLTGRPISELQEQWDGFFESEDEGERTSLDKKDGPRRFRYPCAMVGLAWPRPVLHERIAERVQRMLDAGLLEEARWVYEHRAALAHTPLQAVAYKEFFPYFEGKATLAEAEESLVVGTRRLAKSQSTWFRKFPCRWIEMDGSLDTGQVADKVLAAWSLGRADRG